ncbi:hypothetical protein GF389_01630 [Candidatus Dojkabacteria bacterium]|nr:hypothetical protein [Candidatus Dojkabacteria bacterium]
MSESRRKQKKLGLSMRGGAAKTASYLGVIRALEENDIEIHAIVGSSGGAIAGGSYAALKDVEKCIMHYTRFTPNRFIGFDSLRDMRLASDDKTIEFARELTGNLKIQDAKIPLFIQVTDIDCGESVFIEKGEIAKTAIASSAMPWVVKPIVINNRRYVDGDISSGFGVSFLKSRGIDVVFGFCPSHAYTTSEYKDGIAAIARPVDIMTKQIRLLDQLLDPVDLMFENLAGGFGLNDFKKAREIADNGYKVAMEKMDEIKSLLY